ncbi:MAG TPA: ribonuclease III [Planctomycetes bacterium]|nr:ribonuclease III [Planctomycetota bacterium]
MPKEDDLGLLDDTRFSDERLARLEAKLGYRFRDRKLLALALCHSSSRQKGLPSNERLEFLGDAVLGFLVSLYLYEARPRLPEGELTRLRSRAVSGPALHKAAGKLGLEEFIAVGKGLEKRGPLPAGVLADTMEALVAAVFLDGGTDHAWAFVVRHFFRFLTGGEGSSPGGENYKSHLQILAQKKGQGIPSYRTVHEEGPPHARSFAVEVEVGGRCFGPALGRTIKEAEQGAARMALEILEREEGEGKGHGPRSSQDS